MQEVHCDIVWYFETHFTRFGVGKSKCLFSSHGESGTQCPTTALFEKSHSKLPFSSHSDPFSYIIHLVGRLQEAWNFSLISFEKSTHGNLALECYIYPILGFSWKPRFLTSCYIVHRYNQVANHRFRLNFQSFNLKVSQKCSMFGKAAIHLLCFPFSLAISGSNFFFLKLGLIVPVNSVNSS